MYKVQYPVNGGLDKMSYSKKPTGKFQLYYITDKDCFADMKKVKYFTRSQVEFMLGNDDKAKSFLYDLETKMVHNHLTSEMYEMNVGGVKAVHVYTAFKDQLPFRSRTTREGVLLLYLELENREVTLITSGSDAFTNTLKSSANFCILIKTILESEVAKSYKADMGFNDVCELLYEQLNQDVDKMLFAEPAIISWDENEFAFKKFNPSFLQPGPMPAWDSFLTRLDFPDVFCAFVWSIFEPEDSGRQACWIQGFGNEGKSTVIRAITEIFGKHCTAAISHRSYTERFFFSEVYGKRLAVYSDSKNPRLISESRIHSLLGGDYVNVEAKGDKGFIGKVYSKLLIGSNLSPETDPSKTSERTRVLYLEVKGLGDIKIDYLYENKLVAEAAFFLHYCKQKYAELCPSKVTIIEPAEMKLKFDSFCESKESSAVDNYLNDELEFSSKARVKPVELFAHFRNFLAASYMAEKVGYSYTDLKNKLKRLNIVPTIVMEDKKRTTYFIGIKLRPFEVDKL